MPEGDTIHHAARRVGAALVGHGDRLDRDAAPAPRAWTAGPSAWRAARVRAVDARGKHLFLRFEGDLTLHSHLRMGGLWGVYRRGRALAPLAAPRLARDPHRRARGGAVRRPGARADDRRRAPASTSASPASAPTCWPTSSTSAASSRGCARTTRRARSATPCSTSASSPGIGNIWKAEALLPGAASTRGGRLADVTDDEALAVVRAVRPLMRALGRARRLRAEPAGSTSARAALPRAAARSIRSRGQGDDNRTDLLVPGLPGREARRPQGRRPRRARQHRSRASRRRSSTAWT